MNSFNTLIVTSFIDESVFTLSLTMAVTTTTTTTTTTTATTARLSFFSDNNGLLLVLLQIHFLSDNYFRRFRPEAFSIRRFTPEKNIDYVMIDFFSRRVKSKTETNFLGTVCVCVCVCVRVCVCVCV